MSLNWRFFKLSVKSKARSNFNTKSVFNSVINSQVINCFSPHPTPHFPIPFKQDLLSRLQES
ncbi:MAG: hypothetical protein EWV57_19955 [Microcystis aeruginosa Ma_QC_Ch_20071001_S25D]|uniref:Uncharacterized protein n=1 Tax=Microcystis aeruginosa Ma_QC_Ch_20071001_S25D TaxID=2486250 RepID=A0A552FGF7_MICAE|nr:MAG: hypothetical protein EWV57_19955 [Microcystis aeruginosa Ma_QC_Ch_20071001_S25D]TRU56075.1 MAG: hypothetical protein EWV90_23450 [Microcystis aeruginosa Ma_QC_Ch_20071001_M135]